MSIPECLRIPCRPVAAVPGQSLVVALMVAGIGALRTNPLHGAPRGAFCLSGVCQECVIRIEGVATPACQVLVRDKLVIALGRTDARDA